MTSKYLGRITEVEGLIAPRPKKFGGSVGKIESDKEYGVTALYNAVMPEYSELLKTHFPDDWQTILAMAYLLPLDQTVIAKDDGLSFQRKLYV